MKDENVIVIVGKVDSSEVKGRNGKLTAFKINSLSSRYDKATSKYQDIPNIFDVIIFEPMDLKPGDKVRVSGHLSDSVFTTQAGKTFHNAQIVADMVKVYKPYGSQQNKSNEPDRFEPAGPDVGDGENIPF